MTDFNDLTNDPYVAMKIGIVLVDRPGRPLGELPSNLINELIAKGVDLSGL